LSIYITYKIIISFYRLYIFITFADIYYLNKYWLWYLR